MDGLRKARVNATVRPARVRDTTMDPATTCPRCGAARLANAPAGLCPRCLLQHGLRAGQAPGMSEEVAEPGRTDERAAGSGVTLSWMRHPSRPSGLLSALDE